MVKRELEGLVGTTEEESKILRRLERHGLSSSIDDRMLELASHVGGLSAFFSQVSVEYLQQQPRPDAVNHHLAYLPPNVYSSHEQEQTLALVDLMCGEQVPEVTAIFAEYFAKHDVFERLKNGEKFLIPSNHLELPDQGFTLGYISKAAREQGIDRLEDHITLFIGRLLGYFQLGDKNVIDDILRKAGGILKTFPVSGSEAMREEAVTEDELDFMMKLFRKYSNGRTKHEFERLIRSSEGQMIMMAGGGSQDHKLRSGTVEMHPFGHTTSELLALACKKGATILPLFADYGSDVSLVEFGDPMQISSGSEAHRVGEIIAEMGTVARHRAITEHPEIERFKGDIVYPTPDK